MLGAHYNLFQREMKVKFSNQTFILNDEWIMNLREQFKHQILFLGGNHMLDKEEMQFIYSNTSESLEEINKKIEYFSMEMAEVGARLNELYQFKRKLESISQKFGDIIKEAA